MPDVRGPDPEVPADLTRIAVVGGGPGGLLLATLLARGLPSARVTVVDGAADPGAGGGPGGTVVLPGSTLTALDAVDPDLHRAILGSAASWERARVLRGPGTSWAHPVEAPACAVARRWLLERLTHDAVRAGVGFVTAPRGAAELRSSHDLVVVTDGTGSTEGGPGTARRAIRFGTARPLDALEVVHRASSRGGFVAWFHPAGPGWSSVVVETDEETFERAGLDEFDVDQPLGPSDEYSQFVLEELFDADLEGHGLHGDGARWAPVPAPLVAWGDDGVVGLGDAADDADRPAVPGAASGLRDAVVLAGELVAVGRGEKGLDAGIADYVSSVRGSRAGSGHALVGVGRGHDR